MSKIVISKKAAQPLLTTGASFLFAFIMAYFLWQYSLPAGSPSILSPGAFTPKEGESRVVTGQVLVDLFEISTSVLNREAPQKTASPSIQKVEQVKINAPVIAVQVNTPKKDTVATAQQASAVPKSEKGGVDTSAQSHAKQSSNPPNIYDDIRVTQEKIVDKDMPLEAASAKDLGINKIESGYIALRSGVLVRIGESFPSGERLISADPQNGQIITDRRTIVVF